MCYRLALLHFKIQKRRALNRRRFLLLASQAGFNYLFGNDQLLGLTERRRSHADNIYTTRKAHQVKVLRAIELLHAESPVNDTPTIDDLNIGVHQIGKCFDSDPFAGIRVGIGHKTRVIRIKVKLERFGEVGVTGKCRAVYNGVVDNIFTCFQAFQG